MNYAALNDLEERFGRDELLGVAPGETPDTLDDSRLNTALDDASRVIDSYLRSRQPVPISPVPGVLVGAACDIARYKLYDDGVPDTVQDRYEATMKWLKDIGAGRASLGEDDTSVAPTGRVARRAGKSGFKWEQYVV